MDGMHANIYALRPSSRGTVTIRSANPLDPPIIQPNFLTTASDRELLHKGVQILRDIIAQPAFNPYRGDELNPGKAVHSSQGLDEWIAQTAVIAHHASSTCSMGTEDNPMSVVDAELRVRGVEGLRVVDASVMPRVTSGNTAAPTVMIAERAADLIRGVAMISS
jgi:choline dehydrogenase